MSFRDGFGVDDALELSANNNIVLRTAALFRDPSAWYHIVYSVDTTQATAANRAKIYVNGVEQSYAYSNYPAQNADLGFNNNAAHSIGRRQDTSANYFSGYLTEVNFIDGQALAPSDFGETDSDSGAWIPKQYSGSYGSQGWYLKFADNSGVTATTLGKDSSGNSNNWTPNNFSVTAGAGNDSLEDTPTNNWCTANPLDAGSSSLVFSNGNLDIGSASGNWTDCRSTFAVSSGKWYWETKIILALVRPFVGILSSSVRPASNSGSSTEQIGTTTNSYAYWALNGTLRYNSGNITVTTASVGDTVQIALDMDNGKIYFGLNNTYFDSSGGSTGAPSTGSNPSYSGITLDTVSPAFELYNGTSSVSVNFGQRAFTYTPPTGFKALNAENTPVPTVKNGTEYFNTVLYTGNSSTQTISGVGFQPDWVWIKQRNAAENHFLTDAVRGAGLHLRTDSTAVENDDSATFTAFTSDGFSLTGSGPAAPQVNDNSDTYVAWNWKANGSGSANTDGSISSTASVNADAGFSIVEYTGNATQGATVGHGLGIAPRFIVTKKQDFADDWFTYHESAGNTKFFKLNSPNAAVTSSGGTAWANTSPTSTVFSLGSSNATNRSGEDFIAYCFAEVEGYSKFGSYTGNGSSDGTFVYLGFRPALVWVKSETSSEPWVMMDDERPGYNPNSKGIYSNTTAAENDASGRYKDFLSNGFKARGTSGEQNSSGTTYVFMAFASTPFKYANAR